MTDDTTRYEELLQEYGAEDGEGVTGALSDSLHHISHNRLLSLASALGVPNLAGAKNSEIRSDLADRGVFGGPVGDDHAYIRVAGGESFEVHKWIDGDTDRGVSWDEWVEAVRADEYAEYELGRGFFLVTDHEFDGTFNPYVIRPDKPDAAVDEETVSDLLSDRFPEHDIEAAEGNEHASPTYYVYAARPDTDTE